MTWFGAQPLYNTWCWRDEHPEIPVFLMYFVFTFGCLKCWLTLHSSMAGTWGVSQNGGTPSHSQFSCEKNRWSGWWSFAVDCQRHIPIDVYWSNRQFHCKSCYLLVEHPPEPRSNPHVDWLNSFFFNCKLNPNMCLLMILALVEAPCWTIPNHVLVPFLKGSWCGRRRWPPSAKLVYCRTAITRVYHHR